MQKRILCFLMSWLAVFVWQNSFAQTDTLCDPNENKKLFGELNFNYGSATNVSTSSVRTSYALGQPLVASALKGVKDDGTEIEVGMGLYSPWYLPPEAPVLLASQGDYKDRIILNWNINALSPLATQFRIYRDGTEIAKVDSKTTSYPDVYVQAGEYYQYSIVAENLFGYGMPARAVGFVNPNGVVSGTVVSNSGNPVPGVEVRLTPVTGSSLAFDGVDDELCVSYNPEFPTDKFTVSAYVKLGDVNNEGTIIDWGSTLNKNWWITTTKSNEPKGYVFHIGNGTGSDSLKYYLPNPITNPKNVENWHQVTMVYNGAAMSVMVDGEFVGTKPASIVREKNYLNIGSKVGNSGFFKGNLDDIRVYNRPLTQTEVNSSKNRTVSKSEKGLVSYWKMDEGVGVKVFDYTNIQTNATIMGATFKSDKPEVYNAGITDVTGYYLIDGINYSSVESFRAIPMKNFEYNTALEFNAAEQTFAHFFDYDMPDTSTVQLLFRPFDLKSRQTILSKGNLYEAYIDNGKLFLNLNGTLTDLGVVKSQYYHLATTLDNTAGKANIYLEGDLKSSVSFNGTSNWKNGRRWLMGTNDSTAATGKFYTGLIDEFAIFKTALPQNVIQTHRNIGIARDTSQQTASLLFSHFDLNEGSDTTLYDYAAINFGFLTPREGKVRRASWSNNARIKETKAREFQPNQRVVNLNASNTAIGNIDFRDVSSVNVSGYVRFENTFCFEDQVEILVNGQSNIPQIFTDKNGKWSADFEPGKTFKLSASYKDHVFSPSSFGINKIQAPKAGIVFLDKTKRFIRGQVTGGECKKSILPVALDPTAYQVLKIESTNGCFSKIDTLRNADGKYLFDNLPALSFETKYMLHSYDNSIKDYFNIKGGQLADLKDSKGDTLDFVYISKPAVRIDTSKLLANKCGQLIAYQTLSDPNKKLKVKFQTFESYFGGDCVVDSVKYTVNNDIGDRLQETFQSDSTEFLYESTIGVPNILVPYTKKLEVNADYKGSSADATINVVVLGMISQPASFTTSTNGNPYLILRDPPGDQSTATLESGTTVCESLTRTWANSIGLEIAAEWTFGEIQKVVAAPLGVGVITEQGTETKLKISTNNSYTNSGEQVKEVCVTNLKSISTSADLVGRDGDIFAGYGLNYKMGINDRLSLGLDSCSIIADQLVWVSPNGFSTEYIYTRQHIETDVIPSLKLAKETADNEKDRKKFSDYLYHWEKVLILDSLLLTKTDEAKENISFDAGVTYSKSITTSAVKSLTKTDEFSSENSIELESNFEVPFLKAEMSGSITYQHGETWADANSTTNEVTFSYELADDDIGDNFSVDIAQFVTIPSREVDMDELNRRRTDKFASIEYPDVLWSKRELDSLNTKINQLINLATEAKKTIDSKVTFLAFTRPSDIPRFKKPEFNPGKAFRIYPITADEIAEYNIYGSFKANFPDPSDRESFKRYVRRDRKLNLPEYVSPSFKLVAGETMCPWEGSMEQIAAKEGSLNREQVSLFVDKNVQSNIPKNTPAVYHLKLGNLGSAIKEQDQMTYKLGVVSGTNPRGAVVKVNGFNITEPIPFVLNSREVLDVTLTIEKGPEDFEYKGIKVAFYSECETGVPNQNSIDDISPLFYKEVSLDAKFIEPCSPVDIAYPLQNFVVTPADLNKVSISLVEYDKNDTDLKEISVSYRRVDGDGLWSSPIKILKPDELGPLTTPVVWNLDDLKDDFYEIRAVTVCQNTNLAPGVSTIIRGKLERTPPVVVGIPEPADGTWDPGDEISITFNEPIDCDKVFQADNKGNNTIGLYDATTNQLVDATITCVGNKIIIVPKIDISYENRTFRVNVSGKSTKDSVSRAASIRDKAGNMIEKELSWEFNYNQNNLEWVGTDIIEVNEVLKPFTTKRQVRNRGGSIASFRMEDVPSWITVTPSTGTLNPGQVADVTFTFQNDLLIGDYTATMNLVGTNGKEPLGIDYRVRCPQPNYVVDNPSEYESSMNIVTRLSIFDKFSMDPSDVIVAKIDGKIRGVGKVNYYRNIPPADATPDPITKKPTDESNRWLVFMTIFGDESDNDKPIEFRVWDGDKCNEYVEVINKIKFQTGELIGRPNDPDTVKVINVVRKCIPLNRGWNWVSFNLNLPEGNTVPNVLASLKLKSGAIIKGEDLSAKYYGSPFNNWLGSLKTVNPQSRYMINVSQRDTVCMRGTPYNSNDFPITINPGWNWVGYVPSTGMTVAQALRGLTPLDGDIIKSQTLFAQYVNGYGWIGNLNFLEPLKGYLLKISNAGTLVYPAGTANRPTEEISPAALAAQVAQEAPMTFDFTKYQLTMNLIGKVNGMSIEADDELRAYINGELVGINKSISYAKDRLFFQTIYFEDETNISFKLYKADRKKEYDLSRTIPFKSETLAGLVEDPIVFELQKANVVPITIDIKDQIIWQPTKIFPTVSIPNAVSGQSTACGLFTFNSVLPTGADTKPLCIAQTGLSDNMTGVMKINYNERSTFVSGNDVLSFINPATRQTVGCGIFDSQYGVFNINIKGGLTETPIDVVYYSDAMKKTFTVKSGVSYRSNRELGDYLNPAPMDVSPLSITNNNGVITAVLRDTSWTGKYCIDAFALNCPNFGDGQTTFCFQRMKQGACLDIVVRNVTEGTNDVVKAVSISSQVIVNSGVRLEYKGGNKIELKPGFETKAGTVFTGKIEGCSN